MGYSKKHLLKMRTLAIVFALSMILSINCWNKIECNIFADTSKAILDAGNKCANVKNGLANDILHEALTSITEDIPKCNRRRRLMIKRRLSAWTDFKDKVAQAATDVKDAATKVGKSVCAHAGTSVCTAASVGAQIGAVDALKRVKKLNDDNRKCLAEVAKEESYNVCVKYCH